MVSAEKKPLKAPIEDATQRSILESKKSPAKNELSKDALIPRVTSKSHKPTKDTPTRRIDAKKLDLKELIKKHLQAGATRMDYSLSELHQLLDLAKVSMQKMPTLVEVSVPMNICGNFEVVFCCLNSFFRRHSRSV